MNNTALAISPSHRVLFNIRGQVQGVGYRKHMLSQARKLKVTGWVGNCHDGTVQACVEGDIESIHELYLWALIGPERALVTGVECVYRPWVGEFSDFTIRTDEQIRMHSQ